MLDKMGGGLPVMVALLFCKEIKKRYKSESDFLSLDNDEHIATLKALYFI